MVPTTPPYSPPPPGHTTVIVVSVCLGGLFFLAFLAAALFFYRKRKKEIVEETEVVDVVEHVRVQEAIVPGPCGPEVVVLSVDEDIEIREEVKKTEVT
ncbi:hypothetical protein MUK42_21910 [Musa troglodytarum]|uniref:Uncharacterized protein n=1 Tax=Musa troglodytarum TaxID=320322 RepID=A0A9E7KCG1_9LILI|nr:hypothetical protein MUK42_21910 [Musa troglodytarum]